MKITRNKNGSLTVTERGPQAMVFDPQQKKYVLAVDGSGAPIYTGRCVEIERDQLALHRRDPDFEAALPDDLKA